MTSAKYLAVVVALSVSGMVFAQGPVNIPDANLKAAIEAELGISDPTAADMLGMTQLMVEWSNVSDVTGLEHATDLIGLSLAGNQISDLSPLSGLTNLLWLYLPWNQISDLSPLSGLNNLDWLLLGHNQISDVSALSGLTNM